MHRKDSRAKKVTEIFAAIFFIFAAVSDVTTVSATPEIHFTSVPPIGSFANLYGNVIDAPSTMYNVACYIIVNGGAWIKPYNNAPITPIGSDGTWSCDITTGGIDEQATHVYAFLIPKGYNPPLLNGATAWPDELVSNTTNWTYKDRTVVDPTPTQTTPQPTATTPEPTVTTPQPTQTTPQPTPTSPPSVPGIEITYVPPYASNYNVKGIVKNVTYASYNVVTIIKVGDVWWGKPTLDAPLTPINSDGTWSTDITTGGSDPYASMVRAYLVPAGYTPPLINGLVEVPQDLENNAVAKDEKSKRPDRMINFAGRQWKVKHADVPVGPGLNYFSDSDKAVFVDDQGRLHLKIIYLDGKWRSSEVILNESLGYGEYHYYIASRVDRMDKNAVGGLFTWDVTSPLFAHREFDFEFGPWGIIGNKNAQYVMQPWDHAGNMYRFMMDLQGNYSVHSANWSKNAISFRSLRGLDISSLNSSDKIDEWVYMGSDLPLPGNENVRINLWLYDPNNVLGLPPSDGKEVEMVIWDFKYVAPGATIVFIAAVIYRNKNLRR